MKKVDRGEFFDAPFENTFGEYKKFAAEQYLPVEIAKPPTETVVVAESFADNKQSNSNNCNNVEPNLNDLTKRYNELNGGEGGMQSTAGSQNSAIQAATTGGGSNSATSSGAASNAATTVGVTSAAAVVVAVVLLAVSLFPFIGKLVSLLLGADFVAITLDVDSVIAGDSSFEGLSPSEFRIELVTGEQTKSITAKSGKQTYLFGGLTPNTKYTYNVVCDNPKFAQNPICYTDTVTTSSVSKPTAICDTTKTYATPNEETQTVTVNFSAYVSDYFKQYDNYMLYIVDATQPKEMLFVSTNVDENGYFCVVAENIFCQTILITIVGNKNDEPVWDDLAKENILLSYQMATDIPQDWFEEPVIESPLTLHESSLEYTSLTLAKLTAQGLQTEGNQYQTVTINV